MMPAALPAAEPLTPWKSGVTVSAVSDGDHHSIHAYFNTSPESPDGRWVLFYASTTADGHEGEIRIRQRATGKEIVLAENVVVEDAHRAACQQWVSSGRRVAFHNVLPSGEWVVMRADVTAGHARVVARGRQLGFGQPHSEVVPLYGPHWEPGDYRDLELLNVTTGEIQTTGLTAEGVKHAYPDWVVKTFGERPISIFFPILSPNLKRVMCKIATPAGGDFRSPMASVRHGLICYDLENSAFLSLTENWGHPSWHADSKQILNVGLVIESTTGKSRKIPSYPRFRGDHPSFSPDGKLFTTDTLSEGFGGPKGYWDVIVGDVATGEFVRVHRFNNSQGAKSWRVSHPHPAFSPDGRRIYFNVSDGPWTRLHVAEVSIR
jgi:Tol biopolymer transport system component